MDPKMMPVQPDPSDEESMRIYRRHVHEFLRFLRIKDEVSLLVEREKELYEIGRNECPNVDEEFEQAKDDYEVLRKYKEDLKLQVIKIELKKQQEEADRDPEESSLSFGANSDQGFCDTEKQCLKGGNTTTECPAHVPCIKVGNDLQPVTSSSKKKMRKKKKKKAMKEK